MIGYASLRKNVPDVVSTSSDSARATLERILKQADGAALDEVTSKKNCSRPMAFRFRRKRSRRPLRMRSRSPIRSAFPVVAKVVSADILHKSDVGGVVLNLNSAADVRKAFNTITGRVKKLKGKPKLEGILIAQQVKADLELVVGASLDAEMGPVVLFGTRRYRH